MIQNSYTMLFQPVFPFQLANGDLIFFRPAISLLTNQPVFTGRLGQYFRDTTQLGDIGFDLAWGRNYPSGLLLAAGIVSSVPKATSNAVSSKHWLLGPEALVGVFRKWGVVGIFPNHFWDAVRWGDKDVSITQIQPFLTFLLGSGWTAGSAPIMNYDWEAEAWTIPLQLQLSKTTKIGATPWKWQVEVNYYVEQPNAFGPKWKPGLNVTPVVKNVVQEWIKRAF